MEVSLTAGFKMTAIASEQIYAQLEDTEFRSGISTNFWNRAAKELNFCLDRTAMPTPGLLLCSSSGSFTTTSATPVDVTNQSGSLVVLNNRPIIMGVIADGSTSLMDVSTDQTDLQIIYTGPSSGTIFLQYASVSQTLIWTTLAAGTYTFTLQASKFGGSVRAYAKFLKMFVRQM